MAKQDSVSKVHLSSFDDLFQTDESREDMKREKLMDIPISKIQDFPEHPYKVKDDENMVELVDTYSTLYAHCSALHVSAGQTVKQGQVIADCGSTGYSTGPHLHYEVIQNGVRVNALLFYIAN